MVEAIDRQHFGFGFRSELLDFYWEMDVDSGLLPAILCLEGVAGMLKVIVQVYVLHVHVEILQLFPLKPRVLRCFC